MILSAKLSYNVARFLHDCLADLAVWYENETLYTKQAVGGNLPGFQRVWASRKPGDLIPEKDVLHYKEFHAITTKWHKKTAEVRTLGHSVYFVRLKICTTGF